MLEALFVSAAMHFQTGLDLSSLVLVEASEKKEKTKDILFMIEKNQQGGQIHGPKGRGACLNRARCIHSVEYSVTIEMMFTKGL